MHNSDEDKLFCRIAISLGYITGEQASQALHKQQELKESGHAKRIGAHLFDVRLLSRDQVGIIIQEQYRQQTTAPKPPISLESLNALINSELAPQAADKSPHGMQNLINKEQASELQDFIKAAGLTGNDGKSET